MLDAELVGRATLALGAGRATVDDQVDPAVGAIVHAHPGDHLSKGDPILELHYRKQGDLEAALALIARAVEIGDDAPERMPLVSRESVPSSHSC